MECENNLRHNKRDKSMPGIRLFYVTQEALQPIGDQKGPAQGSFIGLYLYSAFTSP